MCAAVPGERAPISRTCRATRRTANPPLPTPGGPPLPEHEPASLRGICSPSGRPCGPQRRWNRFPRLSLLPPAPSTRAALSGPGKDPTPFPTQHPSANFAFVQTPLSSKALGHEINSCSSGRGEGKQRCGWEAAGRGGRGFTARPRRVMKETDTRHPGHREQAGEAHSCRTPAVGPHLVAGPGLKRSRSQGWLRAPWPGRRTDAGCGGGPGSLGALLCSPRGHAARRSSKPLALSPPGARGPAAPASGRAPPLRSGRAPGPRNRSPARGSAGPGGWELLAPAAGRQRAESF